MFVHLKKKLLYIVFTLVVLLGGLFHSGSLVEATPPQYVNDFSSSLTSERWVIDPSDYNVSKDKTLRQNVVQLFYPNGSDGGNQIYKVIRDMTLGIMIVFLVRAGASLLFSRDPKNMQKTLWSLIYMSLGGVFIYGANRLFGSVLNFNSGDFVSNGEGFSGFTNSLVGQGSVLFFVLSILKAAAFFAAIVMTVITGFRVVAASETEKGKKLVKGLINVVVALLVIKGIDFIYYITADSENFVENATDFIINVAKIFGYIYGVIIVIMVFVSGYLYITDGGSGSNFKKAGNILVNILLSALVLFAFLLILYQIFAEFQTGGDAVTDIVSQLINFNHFYV